MLDTFLEVAAGHYKKANDKARTVELMSRLPKETLMKIASGQLKLSGLCGDDDWLEKYKGTPLLPAAIQLAQQELELEQQDIEQRAQRRAEREEDDTFAARDQLQVQKKMLDLELAQVGEGAPSEQAEPEAAEPAPEALPPPGPEPMPTTETPPEVSAPPGMGAAPIKAAAARMRKAAAVLDMSAREKIKSKNFAIPKGGKGEGSYPIHDPEHARNALTRVRQFGSPAEKSKVYAAVAKRYPALATRSEVIPEKKQRTAEKKLGLSKGEESMKMEKAKQKVSGGCQKMSGSCKTASELQKEALGLGAIGKGISSLLTRAPKVVTGAASKVPGAVKGGTLPFLSRLAKPVGQAGQRFTGFAKASSAQEEHFLEAAQEILVKSAQVKLRDGEELTELEKVALGAFIGKLVGGARRAGSALLKGGKSLVEAGTAGAKGMTTGGKTLMQRAAGPVAPGAAAPMAATGGGAKGFLHGVGKQWQALAKTNPGAAAGLVAAPVALAGLGAGYVAGKD